jgi:hypothetical protein
MNMERPESNCSDDEENPKRKQNREPTRNPPTHPLQPCHFISVHIPRDIFFLFLICAPFERGPFNFVPFEDVITKCKERKNLIAGAEKLKEKKNF